MLRRPTASLRAHRGFTLIETIVALALCAVLLLTGLTLAALEIRQERRLAAHRAAEAALAQTWELLRAGALPLQDALWPLELPHGHGSLTLAVSPVAAPPGLWQVTLVAQYDAAGHPTRRQLDGLLRAR